MAKIIKIASSATTPHIANQFKTSRNSTTNPFKYQDFEGNTLDISAFADVFENSSAIKDSNKMKLIAASVAGSMHKFVTGIYEPIVRFVSRIGGGISSAWNYAINTNISDIGAFKSIGNGFKYANDFIHKPLSIPGSSAIDSAIGGIKTHFNTFNENMLDLGKGISSKWSALISKVHSDKKSYSGLSVSELETLWKSEIASASLEEVA